MANKRMFSNIPLDSDCFNDLTPEAKALYFLIGLAVDDDGFTNKIRTIAKTVPASQAEIDALTDAGFLIIFESGVGVIVHHHINNNKISGDRYSSTMHITELAQVELIELKHGNDSESKKSKLLVYIRKTEPVNNLLTTCTQDVYNSSTGCLPRLDKSRLEKNSKSIVVQNKFEPTPRDIIPFEEIVGYFNEVSDRRGKESFSYKTKGTQTKIKARWNEGYRLEDFKKVIDNKKGWLFDVKMVDFFRPETLFSNKFEGYLKEIPAQDINDDNNIPF